MNKETKEKIKTEFHESFKDSSLFECWNTCEKDIFNWWIKKFEQEKKNWVKELKLKDRIKLASELGKLEEIIKR